jgi:DNA-binding MarR family transcriptional regulator
MAELTFQLLVDCQLKEERLAKQFDISVPDFRTLRMFREDRQLHIKTLVERIGLSGSRLTRILDDLERKGFLTRSIDPNDRRSMIVALTPKGSSLAEHLENRFVQIHEEILNGIPEGLHEPLLAGLDKMLSSLEYWLGNS